MLTLILFIFSSDLNFKKIATGTYSIIASLFRREKNTVPDINFEETTIEERSGSIARPQQSFSFDSETKIQKAVNPNRSKYKLPVRAFNL